MGPLEGQRSYSLPVDVQNKLQSESAYSPQEICFEYCLIKYYTMKAFSVKMQLGAEHGPSQIFTHIFISRTV